MTTTDVRPIITEIRLPMALAISEPHHGPMTTAELVIRGVHRCGGRAEACADECELIIGAVLIDPAANPGADPPACLGLIEPDTAGVIVDALLAAAATPTGDEMQA